jgi:hypothetical protein
VIFGQARGRDTGEEKQREIKKKESSTRRSGRKSGNEGEVREREGVVRWASFLNSGCGIEDVWKSGRRGAGGAPVFHASQREGKRGCGICVLSVKRASEGAWSLRLEGTRYAQGGFFSVSCRRVGEAGVSRFGYRG